jgi:hypothetical protein
MEEVEGIGGPSKLNQRAVVFEVRISIDRKLASHTASGVSCVNLVHLDFHTTLATSRPTGQLNGGVDTQAKDSGCPGVPASTFQSGHFVP